jgi:uncharacterized protein YggT (Ycf19 family)
MQDAPNPLLLGLYWIVRCYRYLLVAWILMTWIPGISGSTFHDIVGLPVIPVLNLFSFLNIGFIGLSGIAVLLILWPIEAYLERHVKPRDDAEAASPVFDATGTAYPDLGEGTRPDQRPAVPD